MQKLSKASTVTKSKNKHSSAKTLVVFHESYLEKIMPELCQWLASPAELIGDKIYAVLNMPKGRVNFPGMNDCDICGA